MRLSAPIYRLKRQARLLSRQANIPLNEALDRVARNEGFASWGLLANRSAEAAPSGKILSALKEGDMLLLGARPGQGKTVLGLELILGSIRRGRCGFFFTFDYTADETFAHIRDLGVDPDRFGDRLSVVTSDEICADLIIKRLAHAPRGSVAVIDYLQLLDQKRSNPELSAQVVALRSFAQNQGVILVFLSQIDRAFDPVSTPLPEISDIRLPNPIDLALFSKACFLHAGELQFHATV